MADGAGVGARDALGRRQASAAALCEQSWAAQFRRDERNFKDGRGDLRVWPSPREESRSCYFSSSLFCRGGRADLPPIIQENRVKISWKEQSRNDMRFRARRHGLGF